MNAPQAPESGVAGFRPLGARGISLLEHPFQPASLPDTKPLVLPTPASTPTRPSRAAPLPDALPPWRPSPAVVGPVLAESLRRRWKLYAAQLRACQEDFSEEAVHELRVASRRLISQFVILECVIREETIQKACRMLKRRLKALGELRDAHVQLSFIEQRIGRYPELMLLRDVLRRRERRLEKAAADRVEGLKARKLERWTLALERHLAQESRRSRQAERMASAVARATTAAYTEVVRRRRAINPANPATIHQTRIAFKKFRYMVESLSPDLTGMSPRELRALARYQRKMGILQDLEVVQQCINGFVRKHNAMQPVLQRFMTYLHGRRARALRRFLGSADQIFQFWPPRHAKNNGGRFSAKAAA